MPQPFYPLERSSSHCIGGWVGPRASMDEYGKSHPPPGFDPQKAQPAANCYTNPCDT